MDHNTGSAGSSAVATTNRAMTVRGAAFLGVGSMVGAGIFALLGEAGAVAGAAVWLSFLLAGVVASLQGYAVAKLGARYPSSGGIVTFLLKGFGPGLFVDDHRQNLRREKRAVMDRNDVDLVRQVLAGKGERGAEGTQ